MSRKHTIGAGIALDGERKFKDAVDGITKNMSVLKSEMSKVTAEFKDNAHSMDANKAKSVVLQKQITEQKKKIKTMTGALENATKQFGENSDQVKNWQIKLNNSEAELSKLNSKLNKTEKEIDEMGDEAKESGNEVDKFGDKTKKTGKKSELATKGISKLKIGIAALGTAMVAGVKKLTTQGVQYNSTIEDYEASFETMTGSAQKATQVTESLKNTAAKTPFELTNLADTTQLLMNYGFTADGAMDKMKMLGDISQGSADKMTRISTAYGQMSSAGKVQLEDIKQMIEAGFNPLNEISQTTGESMDSLYNRISKGTISVDEISESMKRSTSEGGKYFGSMDTKSQTLNGRISTLKDTINNKLGEAMSSTSNNLTNNIIPQITQAISNIDVEALSNKIARVLDDVMKFGNYILDNKDVINSAIVGVGTGFATWKIGTIVKGAVDAIGNLEAANVAAGTSAKGLGTAFKTALGPVSIAVAAITAALFKVVSDYKSAGREIEAEQKEAINARCDEMIEERTKETQAQITSLNKQKAAVTQNLNKRLEQINTHYANATRAAQKHEQAVTKSLQAQNKAFSEAHQKRLKELEEEKAARKEAIDKALGIETSKIQSQIDNIDKTTEAENKAIKEKENEQKIADLKEAVARAQTVEEKRQAQQSLKEFLSQLDRERLLESREIQKQELQSKIEKLRQEATAKKSEVDKDIANQKMAADTKFKAQQQSIEKRISAINGYASRQAAILERAKNADIQKAHEAANSANAEIDSRIAKYEDLEEQIRDTIEAERDEQQENVQASFGEKVKRTYNKWLDNFDFFNMPRNKKWSWKVPGRAIGDNDWRGGPVNVHEGKGGEILNLPRHTQIIPHDVSMEYARTYAKQSLTAKPSINNYFGAQQDVHVFQVDSEKVSTVMTPSVSYLQSQSQIGLKGACGYAQG